MRRLSVRTRDEDGAVAVIVAVAMVALVGMAAWVLDAGALYQERRELQNGADAAALAIAENCAWGLISECTDAGANATAADYVDDNALDDQTGLDSVDLNGSDQTVSVNVATATSDGGNSIAYTFAQILGFTSKTVHAKATAAWGTPGAMSVLPLTLEECEYHKFSHSGSTDPIILTFHDPDKEATSDCPTGPAGQDAPGNFGWLAGGTKCRANVQRGIADGETGNDPECTEGELDDLLGEVVAVPIYEQVTGTGSNVQFKIAGFAGFKLLAYRFPSMSGAVLPFIEPPCLSPESCIAGVFTTYVAAGDIDPNAEDFGAIAVELIPNPEETS